MLSISLIMFCYFKYLFTTELSSEQETISKGRYSTPKSVHKLQTQVPAISKLYLDAMTTPQISIIAASESDFLVLSKLECDVFYAEEFSALAFGPQRDSQENIALRASLMAKKPLAETAWDRYMKAVIELPGEDPEIIGFSCWRFVTKREEQGGIEEVKLPRERSPLELLEENKRNWGPGANFKFCEDAFIVADDYMMRSCKGKDYCSKCSPQLIWSLSSNSCFYTHTS